MYSRRECGNAGISKEGGKRRNPLLGFPRFSIHRHFHRPLISPAAAVDGDENGAATSFRTTAALRSTAADRVHTQNLPKSEQRSGPVRGAMSESAPSELRSGTIGNGWLPFFFWQSSFSGRLRPTRAATPERRLTPP